MNTVMYVVRKKNIVQHIIIIWHCYNESSYLDSATAAQQARRQLRPVESEKTQAHTNAEAGTRGSY